MACSSNARLRLANFVAKSWDSTSLEKSCKVSDMKTIKKITIIVLLLLIGGLVLLWTPDTSRDEMRAKYGDAPSRFLTQADGSQIHYRDQGDRSASALVMIHGTSASLHTWEPLISELSGEYRLVSLDLPAHGLTGSNKTANYSHQAMVDAVWAVMTHLNIESASLVGNSLGGAIVWKAALDAPQRVKSLIMLAPSGAPRMSKSKSNIGFKLLGTSIGRAAMLRITPRKIIETSLQQTVEDDDIVDPQMVDRYWELLRMEGNRQAMIDLSKTARDPNAWRRLGDIPQPALIVWGQRDGLLPVEMSTTFADEMVNESIVVMPGIGHLPMEEAVLQTANEIRTFCVQNGC